MSQAGAWDSVSKVACGCGRPRQAPSSAQLPPSMGDMRQAESPQTAERAPPTAPHRHAPTPGNPALSLAADQQAPPGSAPRPPAAGVCDFLLLRAESVG